MDHILRLTNLIFNFGAYTLEQYKTIIWERLLPFCYIRRNTMIYQFVKYGVFYETFNRFFVTINVRFDVL